jgi:hypothetical protein
MVVHQDDNFGTDQNVNNLALVHLAEGVSGIDAIVAHAAVRQPKR